MPWMVAIVKKIEPNTTHCSGSLVAPKFILTAAHCFDDKPKEAFEVKLGVDNLSQSPINFQPYKKTMDIHELYINPGYFHGYYNDIAIIELENEVTFSRGIYPLCLPKAGTPAWLQSGQLVTVAGFGSTGQGYVHVVHTGMTINLFFFNFRKNQKINSANLEAYSQASCRREYQRVDSTIVFNSSILCAGTRVSKVLDSPRP